MVEATKADLEALSEAFAFVGNSLLTPINQTPSIGIDPSFWAAFPDFENERVRDAIAACRQFADDCAKESDGHSAKTRIAVEFAHLFIGPPRPAVPPWETFYAGDANGVGFGRPTFEMRTLLRDAGLRLENENNQYEDHMGIELLLLSVMLRRAWEKEGDLNEAAAFARKHSGRWITLFRERIEAVCPDGYYVNLAKLAESLLALVIA